MKKIIKCILLIFLNCQDGPTAIYNEEFVPFNPAKELPFKELVGTYELDIDSYKRYKIKESINLKLKINSDSTFVATNYINYKNRKIELNTFKGVLHYTNKFTEKPPLLIFDIDYNFNGGGGIDIYTRKKDNTIALYILTPFIPVLAP
jgi:hypothetical protein